MSRAERRRQAREQRKAESRDIEVARMFGMSPGFNGGDNYGLPEKVSRQWIVEHSEEGQLGTVPIPAAHRDGLITHAIYWADCDHIGTALDGQCSCETDDSVPWTLSEFEG